MKKIRKTSLKLLLRNLALSTLLSTTLESYAAHCPLSIVVVVLIEGSLVQYPQGLIWEQKVEDFDRIYKVNVTGVFLSMKYQIPAIKASKGGVIINNASVVGMLLCLGWM